MQWNSNILEIIPGWIGLNLLSCSPSYLLKWLKKKKRERNQRIECRLRDLAAIYWAIHLWTSLLSGLKPFGCDWRNDFTDCWRNIFQDWSWAPRFVRAVISGRWAFLFFFFLKIKGNPGGGAKEKGNSINNTIKKKQLFFSFTAAHLKKKKSYIFSNWASSCVHGHRSFSDRMMHALFFFY